MPRLFFAVELEEPTRSEVASLADRLRTSLVDAGLNRDERLVWVPPRLFHATLQFIGQVDEANEAVVHRVLDDPLRGPPFDVSIGGIGFFPDAAEPRVLWLGIEHGAEQLGQLHEVLGDRLSRNGIVVQERTYRPHVTLGRLRCSAGADEAQCLAQVPRTPIASFRVSRVSLYETREERGGGDYTVIRRAPLEG